MDPAWSSSTALKTTSHKLSDSLAHIAPRHLRVRVGSFFCQFRHFPLIPLLRQTSLQASLTHLEYGFLPVYRSIYKGNMAFYIGISSVIHQDSNLSRGVGRITSLRHQVDTAEPATRRTVLHNRIRGVYLNFSRFSGCRDCTTAHCNTNLQIELRLLLRS